MRILIASGSLVHSWFKFCSSDEPLSGFCTRALLPLSSKVPNTFWDYANIQSPPLSSPVLHPFVSFWLLFQAFIPSSASRSWKSSCQLILVSLNKEIGTLKNAFRKISHGPRQIGNPSYTLFEVNQASNRIKSYRTYRKQPDKHGDLWRHLVKTDWISMDVTVQQVKTTRSYLVRSGSFPRIQHCQARSKLMCGFCEMVHIPRPIEQKVINNGASTICTELKLYEILRCFGSQK